MIRKQAISFLAVSLLFVGNIPVKAEEEPEISTEKESETLSIPEGETVTVTVSDLSEDHIYSFANLQEYTDYIELSSDTLTAEEETFTVTLLKEPEEEIVLQLVDESETEVYELRLSAAEQKYDVTVNGTLTASYTEGETVTVKAEEQTGKRFVSWKVSGTELSDPKQKEQTFEMPANAVELTAEYTDLYTVTVENGTASVKEAAAGDTVTITANKNMKFAGWDGTEAAKFSRSASSVSFVMPAENVTLRAMAAQAGWQKISGKWYYYDSAGRPLTGWQKISGKWYYMNGSGVMMTGWVKSNGKWYYMSASGAMTTGWQKVSGKWYYMNGSGAMLKGWQKINSKWYYLSGSGAMMTGWVKSNNKWYYMSASGAMTTGWQYVSGKWYYMNSSGAMLKGWQKINSKWYYLSGSGAMMTGWVKSNGKWYYMSASGAMTTGWQKVSGKWYYMNSSGAMTTGWQYISGKWYYMNSSGAMRSGWLKLSDHWYYLNPAGDMATGWKTISGKRYYLDYKTGDMARGIVYIGGIYYQFNQSGAYIGRAANVPSMVSDYAYAENADTHTPLISKNADQRMWPASMTKMMTMILTIENIDNLDQRVYVTWDMIHDLDGLGLTQAGYQPGDRPTIRDLLYAACLPSAADATNILAYTVAGDPDTFIDMMNEKAQEIGMINTHFANNHGDDNPQNYSTCRDMAKLIAYGADYELFRKVIGTYDYRTTSVSSHPDGIYLRSIVLIYCKGYGNYYQYDIPGLIGGKSGYTPDAAYTLAVISEENGRRMVYVTGHSWVRRYYPSHVEDASKMALYLH